MPAWNTWKPGSPNGISSRDFSGLDHIADSCYVTTKPFGVLVEIKNKPLISLVTNTDKLIQTALKLLSTLFISIFQALSRIHYMQDLEQNSSS